MRRLTPRRRLLAWLVVALIAVSAVAVLRSPLAWDEACTVARRHLPELLGMEVGIGRCELDPLTGAVRLYGISAYPAGAEQPLLSADSAEVKLGAVQPFFGSVELASVRVTRPRINLDLAPPPGNGKAAPEPAKPPGRCPLEALQRVDLSRMEISDAEVRVTLAGGRRVEITGIDASWRERNGAAELTVDARGGSVIAAADGRAVSLQRLSFAGVLDVAGETLEISRAEADLEDIALAVSGKIEELCEPHLLLDGQLFLPLSRVARALGSSQKLAGHVWLRAVASGEVTDPTVALDVAATGLELGRYRPGDFNAQLTLRGKELKLGAFKLPAGEGEVRASGTLRLESPYPVSVQVRAESAQLARILERVGQPGAWVDVLATGEATLSGALRSPFVLEGNGDMRLARFVLATRPFDAPATEGLEILRFPTGRVNGHVKIVSDRVEVTELVASSGASQVTGAVTLFYDGERGLDVRARAEPLVMADFGSVAELAWGGSGTIDAVVSGPYRSVRAEATASLQDFMFWDFALGEVQTKVLYADKVLSFPNVSGVRGKSPFAGNFLLDFRREDLEIAADVGFERARTQDLVDLLVGLHPSIDIFQGPLEGRATAKVSIPRTVAKTFGGEIDLSLADTTYYGRRLGDGAAKLHFVHGDALVLDAFALQGPLGTLEAAGTWIFDQSLDYDFTGRGVALAELIGPERAAKLGARGTLELSGKVYNTTDVPMVDARLTSPRPLELSGRPMGTTDLRARIEGRELAIVGRVAEGLVLEESRPLTMKLKAPIPYALALQVDVKDLSPFLGSLAANDLSGEVTGVVEARGMIKQDGSTEGAAVLSKLVLKRRDLRVANDAEVRLAYRGGRAELDPVTLRGRNTLLSAQGWAGPERMDVKMQGTLELALLETFLPSIERTAGSIDLTASASGTLARPSLAGGAQLRDARISLRDQPVTVRGLSGNIEFSEQTVLIEDVNGILNDGRVSASGHVLLQGRGVKTMDVSVQVENVYLRAAEDLPLSTSGLLNLGWAQGDLVLGGSVDISRVRYEKSLDLDTFVRELGKPRVPYTGPGEKPDPWLRFGDLVVNLEDVHVDNNLAKAELTGQVKVTGTNVSPGLLGVIRVGRPPTPGGPAGPVSQAFFRGNSFTVTQGVLEFRNRDAIESVFDMHAETQVRDYQVRLHAFGRTSDPKVILTSEPALPEGDILSLLTLGVTSKDRSEDAGATATYIGVAADALMTATGLDRQVQRLFPKNPFLINPSVHITSGYNDAHPEGGRVEAMATLESRVLTQQLKLGMTRPFSGRGTRVNAEYQFENGLSAQAQWDENSEANSPFGNLGLDLKLRWEVE